jgi:hypothetical protein
MRGAMTEKIDTISISMIHRKISQKELRLMPYIQYVLENEQTIDIRRINQVEKQILDSWSGEGFLIGDYLDKVVVTKEFWNLICEVIWESYVVGSGVVGSKKKRSAK